MWQRFTERARKTVFYAQEEAGRLGENYVSTEHLLLGLIRETDSVAARILGQLSIPLPRIRTEIERQVARGDGKLGQDMQLTPRAKRVIDLAYDEARQLNNNYIGTEHLLLGLIREGEGLAGRVLSDLGMTLDQARLEVMRLQGESTKDEILSFDQAIHLLGVSKATLYRLLNQEEIRGMKAGRQWRYKKGDIFAYLERGKAGTQQTIASKAMDELLKALDAKSAIFSAEAVGEQDKEIQTSRLLLEPALQAHASSIHFDPQAPGFILRYRVGGKLQTMETLPMSLEPVLRHFKQAASLDVNETQRPQQGRFVYQSAPASADTIPEEKTYEIAVATLPILSGEALTLHLTEKIQQTLTLETLGLEPEALETLRTWFNTQASGLVLVLGPERSGKTTLLQVLAQEIIRPDARTFWLGMVPDGLSSSVLAVVPTGDGMELARIVQGIAQSDPDHVLVDGLADKDVAWQMIGLALGCIVIAATTANAITEAESLQHDRMELSQVLRGVVTVRLVRRLCPHCKVPASDLISPPVQNLLLQAVEAGYRVPDNTVFYVGHGCGHCGSQGYQGHVGLFDVLPWSWELTGALLHGKSDANVLTEGTNRLAADGVRKAAAGLTTLEEVLRAVSLPGRSPGA